jgi:hypothetical protein
VAGAQASRSSRYRVHELVAPPFLPEAKDRDLTRVE